MPPTLDQILQLVQPWLTVIREHALLAGALFLAAGFLIGLLGRGFAYIVLLFGGVSVGSITLGQFAHISEQVTDPTISSLIVLATSLISAYLLYKAAKLLVYPIVFLSFLAGWFLIFYDRFTFDFTNDPIKVAAWLLLSVAMVVLTAKASKVLLSPKWKQPKEPKVKQPKEPRRTPTKFLRRLVWKRDKGVCRLCGLPADPFHWDLAHDQAYSKGGPLTVENTYVAHPDCNRSVGTMTKKEAFRSIQ